MSEFTITVLVRDTVVSVDDNVDTIVINPNAPPVGYQGNTLIPFSFGDASPKLIAMVRRIRWGAIAIVQTFDVPSSLQLGDDLVRDRLIGAECNPSAVAEYNLTRWIEYAEPTQIKLWVTPGEGCTQGRGYVILEII
jgi:hypothetical protein